MHQPQDKAILVIRGAGHVDAVFFPVNEANSRAANVVVDVPHDVFCSHILVTTSNGHESLRLLPLEQKMNLLKRSQVRCCVAQPTIQGSFKASPRAEGSQTERVFT